jgi:arsenate reductase
MKEITIYHNPRCSKSRQALELIRESGQEANIVEYLKQPPTLEELSNILKLLNLGPRDIIRSGEKTYKELNLGEHELSDQELMKIMIEHPILIERPIVVVDGKVAGVGRPPETIKNII